MANDMFFKLMSNMKKPKNNFEDRPSYRDATNYVSRYFTEDELKQLRSKDLINWVFSDDTWFTKRNYLTREGYISDVVDRGGALNLSNGILYEPETNEVISMRLFDIGDCNSPITWGSRHAQKKFKKLKKFKILKITTKII